MYFQLSILFLFNFLSFNAFDFFTVNNGYRRLANEFKSNDILLTCPPIYVKWIEQKLDHFDLNETRTWKMRYYERLDYWRPNGPIYHFIGGEGPAWPGFLATGILYELARETKGAMYMSEHRYYGKSQPVKRDNIEDMKFLTTTQALADNANLLRTIQKKLSKTSKIVVVGGSYAGNLAAWMRLLYPDVVDAAIASSAPVLAKRDFYEYLEVVKKDYELYGTPDCLEKIQNMFQRYDSLLQSDEGIKQLKKEENLCEESDLTKPENKALFFGDKMNQFKNNAQYNTTEAIKEHCSKLNGTHDTSVASDDKMVNTSCINYSIDITVEEYHKKENDDHFCWMYQSCTEFGYFQSTTSEDHPFTKNIPIEWFDKLCTALFGISYAKARIINGVTATNKMYGGKSTNVTRVVFVNGELDPWKALSILEDISYEAPAVYIPKSSHTSDLSPRKHCDSEELKEARAHIKYLIKKWIGVKNN